MKLHKLMLLMLLPASMVAQNGAYTLSGKIESAKKPAKVFLSYRKDKKQFTDSATVKNGTFEFKGTVTDPVKARLILVQRQDRKNSQPTDMVELYLESGMVKVLANDASVKVEGGQNNKDLKKYNDLVGLAQKKMTELMKSYEAASKEVQAKKEFQDSIESIYTKIEDEIATLNKKFVQENTNSYLSLEIVRTISGSYPDVAILEPMFNTLTDNIKKTQAGTELGTFIANLKKVAIGAVAPDFTQNTPEGNPFKFSTLKGKYVLVDFWASWCGPCRAENPNVVKAFNKYKDKNFTILGVSLDNNKAAWLKAIEKDQLTWNHVSDLKGWNNEVAQLYSIRAVPSNLLIDPSGVIIAKNLRGEKLEEKLAELLGTK